MQATRRQFLFAGAVGAAGAVALPGCATMAPVDPVASCLSPVVGGPMPLPVPGARV